MSMKHFLSIMIIVFSIISCERDVDFIGNEINPLVVINSFVTPDSTVTAYISTSRFFLNDSIAYRTINNAEVNLWIDGVFREKLNSDNTGTYRSYYKPAFTDLIKLTVDVPEMTQASATTLFTQAPHVLSVDTQQVLINKEILRYSSGDIQVIKNHYNVKYKLKFTDQSNQKNYYRLIVRKVSYKGVWNRHTNKVDTVIDNGQPQYGDFNFTDIVSGNTTDPLADGSTSPVAVLLSNVNNVYHVFSDDIFNGKTYTLQFSTNHTQNIKVIDYGSLSDVKHEVYISLQSLSKDYFLYLKTRGASNATNYFSEPVKVHNNINNGLGILGSYSTSNIYRIILP